MLGRQSNLNRRLTWPHFRVVMSNVSFVSVKLKRLSFLVSAWPETEARDSPHSRNPPAKLLGLALDRKNFGKSNGKSLWVAATTPSALWQFRPKENCGRKGPFRPKESLAQFDKRRRFGSFHLGVYLSVVLSVSSN